jgi:hypothetical protein
MQRKWPPNALFLSELRVSAEMSAPSRETRVQPAVSRLHQSTIVSTRGNRHEYHPNVRLRRSGLDYRIAPWRVGGRFHIRAADSRRDSRSWGRYPGRPVISHVTEAADSATRITSIAFMFYS